MAYMPRTRPAYPEEFRHKERNVLDHPARA
jgi:hypothetical protein